MKKNNEFDLLVIGSGPGGQKAAIQALKLGKRVAVVEASPGLGGNCLFDGTIPSKSFREAIMHLSGYRERSHYGQAYRVKHNIEMRDLTDRTSSISRDIEQTIRSQLLRNKSELITGFASFVDPHTLRVSFEKSERIVESEKIVIATGTSPWRPASFEFDGHIILDSNDILRMTRIPSSLTVVGGGVIGCEYGSMFSALGVKVSILEQRDSILGFLDSELVDSLTYTLRQQKTAIITSDKVIKCCKSPDGRAVTYLESGRRMVSQVLLVSAGRVGNVNGMNLEGVGIEASDRGLISVNQHYQTSQPNIYAVGDVIGIPALASTSMEQGRRAACHAFGLNDHSFEIPLPYGIYSIPEIGTVGASEAELRASKIPYEFGIARFSELERGKILGDRLGVLKILFHRNTLRVLGVHIIGEGATELIHVGQSVIGFQGGLDYFVNATFNYPTLSQAYKTAALDGWNKVVASDGLPDEVPYADIDLH
ncbi:MAG TPA: Si-specific NAD(P)(+) transhydrogenase [Oligoflexia bacterium]|nr:Si-specific NAD(P)(+) transhydrogenase [Oligoflexia bacterium]HMP48729.1 Si-specific NAD(P)(+) transhydrogenase [Oligoflexia bacterium]